MSVGDVSLVLKVSVVAVYVYLFVPRVRTWLMVEGERGVQDGMVGVEMRCQRIGEGMHLHAIYLLSSFYITA